MSPCNSRTKLLQAILYTGYLLAIPTYAADNPTGSYLSIEAMTGPNSAHTSGIHGAYSSEPARFNSWQDLGAKIDHVYGGRIEAGWLKAFESGKPYRLSMAYSGWTGNSNLPKMVYGMTFGEPVPVGQRPEAFIKICADDFSPACHPLKGSGHHSYQEIMSKLSVVYGSTDSNQVWLGVQPFYGKIHESSFVDVTVDERFEDGGSDDKLSGNAFGALFSAQKEFRPTEKDTFSISTGIGRYRLKSDSTSIGRKNGLQVDDQKSVNGTRAQLELAFAHQLNANFSLGATARLDYWSDQPYVAGITNAAATCFLKNDTDLVCEPPSLVVNHGILFDTYRTLTFGINAKWHY
jgi:hypothetical protein